MECLEEDQGGRKPDPEEKGLVFTFLTCSFQTLHCLSMTVPLSSHCVCLCVYVCVFVACLNRNKFSLNWHCALLANSWSARKICN